MLTALLHAAALSTSTVLVQAPPDRQSILVIGRRSKDAEDALKACIARRCSPDEEIGASLALAETQIIAGRYKDARETLLRALGRNKDEAERYPIPVSDLYRANGRVAAHLGYDEDYYRSTWGIYRTLKKGLPSAENRHFFARMEVAEMMGRTRGHGRARLYYEDIATEARGAGRPDIAALAELRSYLDHYPPGDSRTAGIRRIAASKAPALAPVALEAKVALARLAYESGDSAAAAAIERELAAMNLKRPILIYSPPYDALEQEASAGSEYRMADESGGGSGPQMIRDFQLTGASATKRITAGFDDMWVDVGFQVGADGRVQDLEILRRKGDPFWTAPLLASVRARRYSPGKPGDPGSYVVERYTYTSAYEATTGTRLATRSPHARMEYFDLSEGGLARPE